MSLFCFFQTWREGLKTGAFTSVLLLSAIRNVEPCLALELAGGQGAPSALNRRGNFNKERFLPTVW